MILSPAVAENVQVSESPAGEIVPVVVVPFTKAPCANTAWGERIIKAKISERREQILITHDE